MKTVGQDVTTNFATTGQAIAQLNTRLGLTGKPLEALTAQEIRLAKVTKEDLGGIIRETTRVFGDWSISSDKQGTALDYLYKVSQTTGIGVSTLSEKLVKAGVPLRQLGYDFETGAAMIGKWEKEGVNMDMLLASLNRASVRLAKNGVPDMNAAWDEMISRIKGAKDNTEAMTIATEYFGSKAASNMAGAVREGRLEVGKLVEQLKKSPETINGAAKDTMSLADHIAELRNRAEVAFEPLGKLLITTLKSAMPFIKGVGTVLATVGQAFGRLPGPVKTAAVAFGAFIVLRGPLRAMASAVGGAFSSIGSMIGRAGSAIGSVGSSLGSLSTGSLAILGNLKVSWAGAFGIIAGAVTAATFTVKHFYDEAKKAQKQAASALEVEEWTNWAGAVGQALSTIPGVSRHTAVQTAQGIRDALQDLPRDGSVTFAKLRDNIANKLFETGTMSKAEASAMATDMLGKWQDLSSQSGNAFSQMKASIGQQLSAMGITAPQQVASITNRMIAEFVKVKRDGTTSMSATRTGIVNILTEMGIASGLQADNMSARLIGAMKTAGSQGKSAISDMRSNVISSLSSVGVKAGEQADLFASTIATKFNTARTQGAGAIDQLQNEVVNRLMTTYEIAKPRAEEIAGAIIGNLQNAQGAGTGALRGLQNDGTAALAGLASQGAQQAALAGQGVSSGIHGTMHVPWLEAITRMFPNFPQPITSGFSIVPRIIGFAEGGIAWKPQLATVAEKKPELITPLDKIPALMGASGAAGDVYQTIHFHSVSEDYDAERVATLAVNKIARKANQTGRLHKKGK
jgi:hypothetical protein